MTISQALAHTIIAYTRSGLSEAESADMVLSFMDRRGLAGFKPAVLKHVQKILKAQQEHTVVRLYSAYPLESSQKTNILSSFSKEHTLEEIIDPQLIGGFRTEHAYRYLDATTAHAVSRLKEHLLHP